MQVVVVGSVALDTIRTPAAAHIDLLGGSASYFSLAASLLCEVGVIAVVGDDFPAEHITLLEGRGIDLGGLIRQPGATFRWEGEYGAVLKERRTLRTELGVFESFHPVIPPAYRHPAALFLANIDPHLQEEVLAGAGNVPLVASDTMNFWIEGMPDALARVIRRVHLLLVNDEEAQLLTGHAQITRAAAAIRALGPEVVVIKKGPHGVAACGPWGWLALPALAIDDVRDPTGAGDSFAGGLIGYLAGRDWRDRDEIATGLAVGTAIASLSVEREGVAAIAELPVARLRERCADLRAMTHFALPELEGRR
ncbi:MAG: sugar kinase [Candidatus Eisenbacteria sp.]|nr:sugar kinase [Candidatus Eisenbacteria bacterium]